MTWLSTKDGNWPLYIRDLPGGQLYVTQYGRGDWRWTKFNGYSGTTKIATGRATNETDAKRDAIAAA